MLGTQVSLVIENNMLKIVSEIIYFPLQYLEFISCQLTTQCNQHRDEELRPCWNEPSSVPKCMISSLETLEWDLNEGAKRGERTGDIYLKKRMPFKECN